ncbi:branched-chain amino acid ABC transporter permease [Burkholderia sp. WAC0059]|uniref:branched-chain amino acid ABC transporter permease n=1 Tax=Burkholderia sp. WAC0059 TaxID=2066022 RepID=UPI000C7EC2E7|nr:branched-chain amino acid ABC transporter permease [Burkholderia sp. WAC0059]PLZ00235.1 branched-chain amino acid ABC transporter permease [Burkholderia sp. WAC0059]
MASLVPALLDPAVNKPAKRAATLRTAATVAVVLIALAVPLVLGGYGLYVAASGAMMAVGAMALTVLSGSAGLPSLGTAAFLAIGAFTSGILATQCGLGFVPAVLIALLLGFAVGLTIALLTLRVSGLYLAVGTLALQHVVQIVATDLDLKLTYASGFMLDVPRIAGWSVSTPVRWWGLAAAMVALVYTLFSRLQRGHVGREWALLKAEPNAAAALGVSAVRTRLAVFALTSAVIATAGAVDGYRLGNVQAASYTLHLAITYLTVVALGGAGRLVGAIVASYALVVLPDAVDALLGGMGVDVTSHGAGIDNMLIGAILAFALLGGLARLSRAIMARRTTIRQEAR